MKQLIKEAKRMQQLAGLLPESYDSELGEAEIGGEKYYAVIDVNGNPSTLIANSKEEMLDMLNSAYKKQTGEENAPYSIEDLEDMYHGGEKLDHVIGDDWATVTKDKSVFDMDKKHVGLSS